MVNGQQKLEAAHDRAILYFFTGKPRQTLPYYRKTDKIVRKTRLIISRQGANHNLALNPLAKLVYGM